MTNMTNGIDVIKAGFVNSINIMVQIEVAIKDKAMVTCAILACKNCMQELQHAARIAGRSNVLENIDLQL